MVQTAPHRRRILRGGASIQPNAFYWIRYVLPALLVYVGFMAWPLLDSVRLSLYSGTSGQRAFVGFANYARLFTDDQAAVRYWSAFRHTWIFFAIHMLVQNVLGMLFAVLLTLPTLRGRQVFQTIIFLPTTLAVLVTGYLWKLILSPVWTGELLGNLGLGFLSRPWLGNASSALISISLVSCWQWVGIPTMMFVAALRSISDDLLEAASIEGANGWQQFARIKLPLALPVVGMIAVLTFVSNFNAFDVVYAMENANGAPNYATDLIGTLFYRVGIAGQHPVGIPDPGLGAAIATVTFIILAIFTVPTLRMTQTKEQL
ncbi:MAG: sugar ABC transporter permease [Oscillospiraceae bacterium]|jgi:raffinose/stachyose/melibiose transport system permease protein|nr:sugar ABC transporter permease [Oscillospiraceae bacterium]